jgi:hypothetical protein
VVCGGAIPARGYSLSTVVGSKQPVIIRTMSFKEVSIYLAYVDLPHTGHVYSATQNHKASAEILILFRDELPTLS